MVSVVSGITPAARVTPPDHPTRPLNGIDTMQLTDPAGLTRAIRTIQAIRKAPLTGITGLGYDRAGCAESTDSAECEACVECEESTGCPECADCRDRAE